MHVHIPPTPPIEAYSQGFWHAVLASCLYLIGSGILSINLVGYLRGHYPQQFDLDDTQRTLILQTTTFFFWLAGGSAIFSAIEGFNYADALYYADVVRPSP
jgi:potassium channel subfamily K, other eukaryote